MSKRFYAVLATLSSGYPPFQGTLLTCYSPVRRSTKGPKTSFSRDLHVLGTPPAFVLSQDQTLQFDLGPRRLLFFLRSSSEEVVPIKIASLPAKLPVQLLVGLFYLATTLTTPQAADRSVLPDP